MLHKLFSCSSTIHRKDQIIVGVVAIKLSSEEPRVCLQLSNFKLRQLNRIHKLYV